MDRRAADRGRLRGSGAVGEAGSVFYLNLQNQGLLSPPTHTDSNTPALCVFCELGRGVPQPREGAVGKVWGRGRPSSWRPARGARVCLCGQQAMWPN